MSNETTVEPGSAAMQAGLWGERAGDWAEIAEQAERPWLGPAYQLVVERLAVGPGTELLDVGCGSGRFCRIAADRGARISGIDATPELLAIARERVPEADLRQGDLQFLPFADASFDLVTGFNSYFFADHVVAAFRDAARVLRADGNLALTAFGRPQQCQSAPIFEYLGPLMPKFLLESDEPEPHEPGVLEALLGEAGLIATDSGYLEITEEHPDLETVLRFLMSAGPVRLAVRNSGEEAVRAALTKGLESLAGPDGTLQITDEYRYVIATNPPS
ncbi:MAG TPA: class I SAM-dependent methyltransferase [Thermoleophilaceae bacterium]|jgi:SAM-dependent methyltransferase|nr:class I SAM-dependent methyltransferase [Actinomycetota bacterium]HYN49701.1 class I SAM-dependent methyltransferase [Thermoleophilaceae bacterium]